MAPFVGPTRAELIAQLRARRPRLPITLGLYEPQAIVERDGPAWVLRPLAIDRARADAAGAAALAAGEMWMPEMEWQFLAPGPPVISRTDLADFIAEIERMTWPYGGD